MSDLVVPCDISPTYRLPWTRPQTATLSGPPDPRLVDMVFARLVAEGRFDALVREARTALEVKDE